MFDELAEVFSATNRLLLFLCVMSVLNFGMGLYILFADYKPRERRGDDLGTVKNPEKYAGATR